MAVMSPARRTFYLAVFALFGGGGCRVACEATASPTGLDMCAVGGLV